MRKILFEAAGYGKRVAQENIHGGVLFKKSCQFTSCIFTKSDSSEELFL